MSDYSALVIADGGANLLGYWPLSAEVGLTDKSGGGHDGTAGGGVTIGTIAAVGELTATDFDGVDDRVTTSWDSGRNACTNPKAGTLATTNWTNNSLPTFAATNSLPTISGLPSGVTTAFHCIADASLDSADSASLGSFAIGDIVTVSFYAYLVTLGGSTRVEVTQRGGTGTWTATGVGVTDRITSIGGSFARYSLGFTCTAAGTLAVGLRQVTAGAAEWYFTAAQFERTATANVPTTYNDGSTRVDAQWEATADLSASHWGPFANGSVRTFEGWANRDTNGAIHTLIGGDGGSRPGLTIASGSNDVAFSIQGEGGGTWTNAWPGTGQWVHWLLVFDEGADSATLYINGVSKGAVARTSAYSPSAGNLLIARLATLSPFDGKQAHLAVYNGDKSGLAASHYAAGQFTRRRRRQIIRPTPAVMRAAVR